MKKGQSEGCPVPEGKDDEDDEEAAPTTSKVITGNKKTNVPPIQAYVDKALIKTLNKENTIDEDLNFALSLVPSLKDLTAVEKLDAKITILSIFKQIRQAGRIKATSQSRVQQHSYNVLQQPTYSYSFPVYQQLQTFQTVPSPIPSAN
ncbi:unnamed protein product [Parnassius apollo]|uniref:(apollo) hypothetical protein n=1 Tax=Parnassius apollo TaxID=110799 RepID=A0A8S3WE28_PARAO|nr:unnamed protein product [Parnassius apollo]